MEEKVDLSKPGPKPSKKLFDTTNYVFREVDMSCVKSKVVKHFLRDKKNGHYAQNWLWKKLKPAGMRPWFLNYAMFSDAESVVFKILTLAKGFLFNFFVLG